jgi:AcrR family transcriptional regulator
VSGVPTASGHRGAGQAAAGTRDRAERARAAPGSGQEPPAPVPIQARLLSVATELFAEKGFDATSVQEVVERAQVTKGALYHYFDSKQDLLYEIYHSIISQQLADLERILAAGEPAGPTLRAVIRNLVETTAARADQAMVFGREMHRLDKARMAAVRADRRRYHDLVRDVVARAQAAGEFAGVADADTVTLVIFGVINQLPAWYRPDGAKSPAQLGGQIADLILAGLRP